MKAEIIAIGTELLIGQIVDTNSTHIAQKLTPLGIDLTYVTRVRDSRAEMAETLGLALKRSQIIVMTGGLGPTEDDLTREVVSQLAGRKLVFHQHLMDQIEALFRRRGFRMALSNRRQAYIPDGAIPIENPMGTAPGFILEEEGRALITLPGVPREMKFLMEKAVIPYLRKKFAIKEETVQYKVLRVCGLGESGVNEQIGDLIRDGGNPSIGLLASPGEIKIRIMAKGGRPSEAKSLIEGMEAEIRGRLGELIYGVDEETLEGSVTKLLERMNLTLSTTEPYTGGLIAQRLSGTESAQFLQGVVLNTEEATRAFLDIGMEEFTNLKRDRGGFIRCLAQKTRERCRSDLGLSVSGLSEKGSSKEGEEIKAHMYIGIASDGSGEWVYQQLGGTKAVLRERAAILALDAMRKELSKMDKT
ncbi:MAG: CinA family nicotinamide mononucleotide deamidase-related protein [Syntrophobacterales bacterium]|nr:MAG: CinA family nicotinamide mononucleotide deamidase-related protein [Syntrophobacterales bacterium]